MISMILSLTDLLLIARLIRCQVYREAFTLPELDRIDFLLEQMRE